MLHYLLSLVPMFFPNKNGTIGFRSAVSYMWQCQPVNDFPILCITASVDSSTWLCLFYCSPFEWLYRESPTPRLHHYLKYMCVYNRVFTRFATRLPAQLVWKAARQLTFSFSNFQKYYLDCKTVFTSLITPLVKLYLFLGSSLKVINV